MPKRVITLAKKELIYAGTFGIAGWLCGGLVFVDRLNSEKAQGTLRKLAKLIKSKNVSRMVKITIYKHALVKYKNCSNSLILCVL